MSATVLSRLPLNRWSDAIPSRANTSVRGQVKVALAHFPGSDMSGVSGGVTMIMFVIMLGV